MDSIAKPRHKQGVTQMLKDSPGKDTLFAAIDKTWPAAALVEAGPWLLREGRGGGKRASATTAKGPWQPEDLPAAESAMRLMGQSPLFMIRQGETALDEALAARGYDKVDPTVIRLTPIETLTDRPLPRVTAFAIWEPLAVMFEIWDEGGLDPARIQVMERCSAPKTGLFGRVSDRPAGTGFCAIHDGVALVHALEIREEHRGKGLGAWMMRCAALWAQRKGARWIGALVTEANEHANGLYQSLQLEITSRYHYRILSDAESDET